MQVLVFLSAPWWRQQCLILHQLVQSDHTDLQTCLSGVWFYSLEM